MTYKKLALNLSIPTDNSLQSQMNGINQWGVANQNEKLFNFQNLPAIDIPQFSLAQNTQSLMFTPYLPSTANIQTFNSLIKDFSTQQAQKISNFLSLMKMGTPLIQTQEVEYQTQGQNSGYGNYNHEITTLYKGTASDLNKKLQGVVKDKGKKL